MVSLLLQPGVNACTLKFLLNGKFNDVEQFHVQSSYHFVCLHLSLTMCHLHEQRQTLEAVLQFQ
jgi:hypothetical protein